jgi:hypothetical protein
MHKRWKRDDILYYICVSELHNRQSTESQRAGCVEQTHFAQIPRSSAAALIHAATYVSTNACCAVMAGASDAL